MNFISLIKISKRILHDDNISIILQSNHLLELKDLGDSVARRISEFIEIFNSALTLISHSFPKQLIPLGKTRDSRLANFIKAMDETEGALDKFGRWIKANKEMAHCMKGFLESLSKSAYDKDEFMPRVKLFVIPIFKDIMKALDTSRNFASEIGDLLPTVKKIAEGHSSTVRSMKELLEFVGYNSSKHSSDVEDFFEAVTSNKRDRAEELLKKIGENYERLKQKANKSPGFSQDLGP